MIRFFFKELPADMRIAMFGGTFDPFHRGHAAIARFVLETGRADRILFMPAPVPPHKAEKTLSPYAARRKMAELGLGAELDGTRMAISDLECSRPGRSYSIDTLKALAGMFPGDRIILLLGGDSLATLHLWYRAEEIVRDFEVLAYPRPGFDVSAASLARNWPEKTAGKLAASVMTDAPVFPFSSTELRAVLGRGENPPPEALEPAELEWIRAGNLYRNDNGKDVEI